MKSYIKMAQITKQNDFNFLTAINYYYKFDNGNITNDFSIKIENQSDCYKIATKAFYFIIILVMMSFCWGCIQNQCSPEKKAISLIDETICDSLESINIVMMDFQEDNGAKKILFLENSINEENSKCFNYVYRSPAQNYIQYLSMIYQEFILSSEGFVPKNNRLKISSKRLFDIEKKLLQLGKKNGFTDTIIQNTLDELKKSETIVIQKNGTIPVALLPQFGKIWQVDLVMIGLYQVKKNSSVLTISLVDIETGKTVFSDDFPYTNTDYNSKKDLARSINSSLRKNFPELSDKINRAKSDPDEKVVKISSMSSSASNIIHIKATGFGETKEKAVDEALINSIHQAAPGSIMASRELHGNILVRSVIKHRINGYIKGFEKKIKQVENGYKATVYAKVSKTFIKQENEVIDAIQHALGNPKLIVVIDEYYNFEHNKTYAAESHIAGKLKKLGFDIIDFKQLDKNEKNRLFNLDKSMVRKIGKMNNQPFFIITGNANLTQKESLLGNGGIKSYTGHLTIKIINPQTADLLDSFVLSPETTVGFALDASSKLLIKLSNIAVENHLDAQLRHIWMDFFNNGIPINIRVENVKSSDVSNSICNCLEMISGVKHYERDNWNNKLNALEVNVKFRGKSEDLADLIKIKCKLDIIQDNNLFIEAKNNAQ